MKARIFVLSVAITTISLVLGTAAKLQAAPPALQPLTGSTWAQENPGILPYEDCSLRDWGSQGLMSDGGAALVYGGDSYPDADHSTVRLDCTSPKLGLRFMIPVTIEHFRRAGADVELGSVFWNDSMTVERLDGKTVADLLGQFRGVEAGLDVFVGGGAQALLHDGIVIRDVHGDLQLGFAFGYVTLTLAARHRMGPVECGQGEMLTGELTRDPEDCWKHDSRGNLRDKMVDVSKLLPLRFKKID